MSELNERMTVGIDGNLGGFERVIGKAVGLLSQFEALGFKAGRGFDTGFGGSATRTALKVTTSIEGLKVKLDQLTLKRDLSIDSSTITKLNREIDQTRAKIGQLKGLGVELPQPSSGAISSLSSYASGMVGIGTAIALARKGFTSMVEFDQMDRKLQAVSTSQADYAKSMAFTDRIADRYGLNIQKLADSYAGLKAASEGTTLAGKQTDAIFEAVTARSAKMGLSTERTEKALLALTQMMSKGKISGEELRQQLAEALPGAVNIMARALGVTTAKLDEMMKKGELVASDVLPKFAAELAKTAEGADKNATSMAGGFNRLQNQLFLLVGEFSKTAGIDSFFGKLTGGLADTLRGVRQLVADRSWGELFKIASNPFMLIGNAGLDKAQQRAAKAAKIDAFGGLSPTAQLNEITRTSQQKKQLEASVARQQAAQRGGIESAQLGRDKAALKEVSEYLGTIYKMAVATQKVEGQSRRAAVNVPKAAIDYAEDYKNKEKEYDALLDKQKGLLSVGKDLTKEEIKRRDVLKQQLALGDPKRYGDKAAKLPRAQSIVQQSSLQTDQRILKRLEAELYAAQQKGSPAEVIDKKRNAVEAFKQHMKEAEEASKGIRKNLDFLDNVGTLNIDGLGKIGRSERFESAGGARMAGLVGSLERSKKGIDVEAFGFQFDRQIEILQRYERSKSQYEKLPGFMRQLFRGVADSAGILDNALVVGSDKANDLLSGKKEGFLATIDGVYTILDDFKKRAGQQAGETLFSAIGDSIGKGDTGPLKGALQSILDMLGNYLIQMGTAITLASKLEALAGTIPGLQGLILTATQKAIIGPSLIVGGVGIKALGAKGFAVGGYVDGDGTGTSDSIFARLSRGEFVIKADSVQKVGPSALNYLNQTGRLPTVASVSPQRYGPRASPTMNPALIQGMNGSRVTGGGGSRTETLTSKSVLRGNDLYQSLERTKRNDTRFGRG